MPYSPSHHYVHVAIPKTGTTSMVRALQQLHDENGGSLELVKDPVTAEFRAKYGLEELGDPQPGRAKHLSAPQLRAVLGLEEYEACFCFTVVRSPWERMVSRYNFTHVKSEPSPEDKARRGTTRSFHDLEFEPWLERAWKRHRSGKGPRSQLSKLADKDGELLVDHVGRLSDVQATIDRLCEVLEVAPVAMPTVNPSQRSKPYTEYYSDVTRGLVADIHQIDIDYFGFTFEELEEREQPPGEQGS